MVKCFELLGEQTNSAESDILEILPRSELELNTIETFTSVPGSDIKNAKSID